MARKLVVEIIGDTSSLERSYRRADAQTKRFTTNLERAGRGATVATVGFRGLGRSVAFASGSFLGAAGLASVLKSSVLAASDLSEQISKTNVVFGGSAAQVEEWSKRSATAMGLARNEALGVASSFGALFKPLGIAGQEAARQSEALTQLGADLASFYNTDVQSALDAIRSGLVGESEPLRRYGVLLSESRVQQEALTETGKQNVSQLTDQEKVLARIALIYRDTGQAQGDFARTSEGLANQTRVLTANLKNLETNIGQALIPGLSDAAGLANKAFAGFHKLNEGLDDIHAGFLHKGLVQDFKDLKGAIDGATDSVAKFQFQFNEPPGLGGPIGTRFVPGAGLQGPLRPTVADARANAEAAQRRNRFFDARIARALDRVQDLPTLRGQIGRLREIAGMISDRMAATKDITRRLTLEDRLLDVQREIRADIAAKNQKAADEALAAAEKLKRQEEKQKRAEKAATDAAARRIAARNKAALANARAINEFSKKTQKLAQKEAELFRHVDPNRLARMLGLPGDRQAAAVLATIGRGGTAPARTSAAFAGQTTVINIHNFHSSANNPRELEAELAKRARGRAHTRRGAR